jgi:hypothetical protein
LPYPAFARQSLASWRLPQSKLTISFATYSTASKEADMNLDRSIKVRDVARDRLNDIFGSATIFGPLSADLETSRRNVLSKLPARAPEWIRAYLDGYWHARIAEAYQYHLVYGGWIGETFYSTHSDRDDYYGKHNIAPADVGERLERRGHYWKRNLRPFFIG